jgi:predicted transposase YbfD/YdcC
MEPDFALMSESFSVINDPRKAGMTTYSAQHLIFMTLCGLISGCDTWVKIADHVSFRSRLFMDRFGLESTPSHDTFSRFFGLINTKQFKKCFAVWVTQAYEGCSGKIVAIDGKAIQSNIKGVPTRYIVSAFVAGDNMILDQVVTDSKSNEITAVPDLLDSLNLEGAVVTMDAMGLQKKNITQIVEKKADYVIALKGNQGNLHVAVKDFFDELTSPEGTRDCWERDYIVHSYETVEKAHGRIETRRCTVTDYRLPASETSGWVGLKTLVMIESIRDIKDKVTTERRYFVSSLEPDAVQHLGAIRSHWSIENSLHWVLDVVFKEDASKIRDKAAAENLSIMRKCALTLVRSMSDKLGLSRRMHRASVDEDYLIGMLGGISSLLNTLQTQN